MDYDQERMFFKGHCIEYDVVDMFQMMVDIALEPRSVLAANVARSKNHKSHDLFNYFFHSKKFFLKIVVCSDIIPVENFSLSRSFFRNF